ncbi:hypothetical protein KPP03845_100117 [Streptomyces xanthophaeus]|uniref:hypothetical protein n=1 Tax=Streptomyces xanthophaeus TaxID=67385 RepID=UPI00233E9F58|nr:hypothetical protein [Streptomyces xanthophaeus]WCD83798.1 hypothetical protein KPP03845_100117 [Streptomyces xanthophaeus]
MNRRNSVGFSLITFRSYASGAARSAPELVTVAPHPDQRGPSWSAMTSRSAAGPDLT